MRMKEENKYYSEIPTLNWKPRRYYMSFNKKEFSVEITAEDGELLNEWEKIRAYKCMGLRK